MLEKYIIEKANQISYTREELSNIAASSNHLREIIKNQPDFSESFLGGSYKRATMVKGVSDVDVYFRYIGNGNSQTALFRLKEYLLKAYPKSEIKPDKPSILVDFNRIPFNITPYVIDKSNRLGIPDKELKNWQEINFGVLEQRIKDLRNINSQYIDLIKILKLWNYNYKKGIRNFVIEIQICNTYLNKAINDETITDWISNFLKSRNFLLDARTFDRLENIKNEALLKSEWLEFIDNK